MSLAGCTRRAWRRKITTLACLVSLLCVWNFLVPKGGRNTNSTALLQDFPRVESKPTDISSCRPQDRIVFLKTHKTGSSTITTMLQRYGYRRDLNFALPRSSHFFPQIPIFNPSFVYQHNLRDTSGTLVWQTLGGFHILANHARYNRPALNALIPNATYVTIIRDPASQFESAFNYFKLGRDIPHDPNEDTLDIFLTDPQRYFSASEIDQVVFIRNGQMFDLGAEQENLTDAQYVDRIIRSLSQEMDLVLINEYFDESLILLKKILCWDFDNIVYISKGVRQADARRNITSEMRSKIEKWNHADVKLYHHFKTIFWEKVQSYGPSFQHELETFRKLKAAVTESCLEKAAVKLDRHKESLFKLPPDASEKCKDLVRYDIQWVPILRKRMVEKSTAFTNKITNF